MTVDRVTLVHRLLDHVQAFELDAAIALFAPDAVLELPFRPGGLPTVLPGEQAHAFVLALPRHLASLRLTDRRMLPTTTDGVVVAEYEGDGVSCSGRPYRNRYISLFEFDPSDRLRLWREYFDPIVLATAMAPA